jgi:hypothetical protein
VLALVGIGAEDVDSLQLGQVASPGCLAGTFSSLKLPSLAVGGEVLGPGASVVGLESSDLDDTLGQTARLALTEFSPAIWRALNLQLDGALRSTLNGATSIVSVNPLTIIIAGPLHCLVRVGPNPGLAAHAALFSVSLSDTGLCHSFTEGAPY